MARKSTPKRNRTNKLAGAKTLGLAKPSRALLGAFVLAFAIGGIGLSTWAFTHAASTSTATTASVSPSPDFTTLSQQLLTAGDQQMMASSQTDTTTAAGSFYAGYSDSMVTGNKAKMARANFGVPLLDCAHSTYGTSGTDVLYIWAGLDGVPGSTVEQTGLEAWCNKGDNTPHYATWFYICCNGDNFTFTSDLGVKAGDQIKAAVCRPNTTSAPCNGTLGYHFLVEDVTNGHSFTADRFCPSTITCNDATAEEIMEVGNAGVSSLGTQWDLPKYTWPGVSGNVGAAVRSDNGNGTFTPLVGAWTNRKWVMADSNGNVMTAVSALSNGGQNWTDTFKSSF